MRIFLGLSDICGYYSGLEEGFTEIGQPCLFVNAYPSIAYHRRGRAPFLARLVESVANRRVGHARGSLPRLWYTVLQSALMAPLFAYALVTCKAFIFGGGVTFWAPYDLWVLRLFRKRVVLVFHGTDTRPPYVSGAFVGPDADVERIRRETARTKRHLRRLERCADVLVNHTLTAHFHEKPVVAWLEIGIPRRLDEADASRAEAGSCRIVHAPTRPGPKGSPLIEAALDRLRARGHDIAYVKLVGRTNADVLEAIRTCDFVVDELFSDTTMATFALEAASFGKAAVVGSYGLDELARLTPADRLPPVATCTAETVEATIERLVSDPRAAQAAGRAARAFVERTWAPALVAQRFARLCHGDVPREWLFDPATLRYLHGWGLTDGQARASVGALVRHAGPSALQLDDKPALRDAFIAFAGDQAV